MLEVLSGMVGHRYNVSKMTTIKPLTVTSGLKVNLDKTSPPNGITLSFCIPGDFSPMQGSPK